jgi:tetratricopeptide (TPR) repeat protein
MERYKTAVHYLDSLFLHYGPHAEGLHLMGQIMIDYIDRAPTVHEKVPYVEKFVAYVDSLHQCCENKDIKSKFKKNCDEYVELSDSVKVAYWKEFYNSGIEQLKVIDELQGQLVSESDSAAAAILQRNVQGNLDSSVTKLQLVTLLNPTYHQAYVGMSQAYEKVGDYDKAIEWISKGLEAVAEDSEGRPTLLFSLAYYHIQIDDFCGAIPYFKEYAEIFPEDTATLYNLAACYNNCKFFDSALAVNRQILQYAPQNTDALIAVGLFHNEQARLASDSMRYYRSLENEEQTNLWQGKREECFDSSVVYFSKAMESDPQSIMAFEQYGTITAIRGHYEEAAVAFTKLTELDPGRSEYWRSLGDFQLRLQKFDQAILSYEKTVELNPGDADTWERLVDLYHNEGQDQKETTARKRLEELR